MPQNLTAGADNPISLLALLINLGVGVPLSLLLRWHFRRFGSTLSNREEFAQVFPFILLTTILIITVVKSSLALSLGLVGALSIVRFRTPVKEPEELAYLFLAIAMGLGLGADQVLSTAVAGTGILLFLALLKWGRRGKENKNIYRSLELQVGDYPGDKGLLDRLNEALAAHVSRVDMRRFDIRNNSAEAVYLLDVDHPAKLGRLIEDLRGSFPGIGVTVLDHNQLPSV